MKKTIMNFAIGIVLGAGFLTICGQDPHDTAPALPTEHYFQPMDNCPRTDLPSGYESFQSLGSLGLHQQGKNSLHPQMSAIYNID